MGREVYLTSEKLEAFKGELEMLKKERRPAVVARIKEARAMGDLSENSEYHSAREEQAHVEGRIEELEYMIKNAKLIKEGKVSSSIGIGSKIICSVEGEKADFAIVGSAEVDIANGKISNESPIGKALMGRKKGDKISVTTPDGVIEYKILEVK
ncbi:transcription elongation factor GreA [Candidatus Microgenomates bacterium]|nr:transcription elongation factor GreA [Candidatus Microgenomates bacterium]